MQKIFSKTDLTVEVQVFDAEGNLIPLSHINYLQMKFYTSCRDCAIDYYKADIDSSGNLCVPSQDLDKLATGVLIYYYTVNYVDQRFPDNACDYSNAVQTDYFLVNATPCGNARFQYCDQYVTRLDLVKLGYIDASTELLVTDFELAQALNGFYTKTQIDNRFNNLPTYDGSIAALDASVQDLQNQINVLPDYSDEIQTLDSSLSALKTQVDGIVIPDYTDEFQAIDASLDALDASMAAIVIPDYSQKFNAIDASLDDLQNQIDDFNPGGEYDASISALDASVCDLQNQINELPDYTDEFQAIDSSVSALDSSLSALKTQVDGIVIPDYTDEFQAIDTSIAALDASIKAIDIPDYTGEFQSIDASLDALDASIKAIDIPDYDASINALDSSMTAIFGIVAEDEEVLAESMTAVNGRIDTLEGIVEEDEETLANALTGINGKFSGYDSSIAGLDASMATTVQSSNITNILKISQADYDALASKDASTFYIIQ